MSFTKKQRAAVKAIVSCHETGRPIGNYSALVVLNDDAGITYGSHQATHKSGSLYKIVQMYVNISNSPVSKGLDPYVSGLKNPALRHKYAKDAKLKSLLREAGKEPAMRFSQDKVFEVNYFEPAVRAVEGSGWTLPLSLGVVYDSMIQGGWTKVRDKITGQKKEKDWIKAYVAARRRWLLSSSKKVVRNSVYRMKTFETLIANDNWELNVPMVVHGAKITADHLALWMAAETPSTTVTEHGLIESTAINEPSTNFFVSNTEGIADEPDELLAGGSWDENKEELAAGHLGDVDETQPAEENPDEKPDESSEEKPEEPAPEEKKDEAEEPKQGEPAPDEPAEKGEAIVGGRPQDPPIIISKPPEEKPAGWRTWPTTITAVLGSLGLSVGGVFTTLSGISLSPQMQVVIGWAVIVGIIVAAIYGLFYLISRMIATNREARQAHDIVVKELELRASPDKYNVKVDRRGDVSNLTESGLPIEEKRA